MQKKQSMWSGQFKSQSILKVALCETIDLDTCSCICVDDVIITSFRSVICWHEVQYFLRVIKICQDKIVWSDFLLAMEFLKAISNHILSRLWSSQTSLHRPWSCSPTWFAPHLECAWQVTSSLIALHRCRTEVVLFFLLGRFQDTSWDMFFWWLSYLSYLI